jgi:transposase
VFYKAISIAKTGVMKNKYLKGSRVSERKFRMLLKLFCEDLTATQIAHISGISRVTINSYLKLIRMAIAQYCEENNPISIFNNHDSLIQDFLNSQPGNNTTSFGIYKTPDGIFTQLLYDVDKATINEIVRSKRINGNAGVWYDKLKQYNGIADFNTHKLIRITHDALEMPKGKSQIDDIDFFWGLIKGRLTKFRGMNNATLYLHVKESEFRYNHRHNDIFNMLSAILEQQPLQFSKAS